MRSLETGYSYVDKLDQIENELLANEVYIGESSPFYKMAQFKKAAPASREISRQALQLLEVSRSLKEQYVWLNFVKNNSMKFKFVV